MAEEKKTFDVHEHKHAFCVEYGQNNQFANVTLQAFRNCVTFDEQQNVFVMSFPACDGDRAHLLGDPLYGVVKSLVINTDEGKRTYPKGEAVKIRLQQGDVFLDAYVCLKNVSKTSPVLGAIFPSCQNINFVQQMLCSIFIHPMARVAQIGSMDAGLTSFVISQILLEPWSQLVVFETSQSQCDAMLDNQTKDSQNGSIIGIRLGQFALSGVPLIQTQSGRVLEMKPNMAWNKHDVPLHCMTIDEATHFFDITPCFDTVVIRGQDALLHFLNHNPPETLRDIRLIITTHEYSHDATQAQKDVNRQLCALGFHSIYQQSEGAQVVFHEVWQRDLTPIMLHMSLKDK